MYLFSENTDLILTQDDVYIEEGSDGGFHLWVRKKPGIGSVLLTESTVDPNGVLPIFALRCLEYNPINGDEKRLLDGKFLEKSQGIVDSTPETFEMFGEAFHLFIPYVVNYGYPWSREGTIQITDGTFINIKTFSKPYADWAGSSYDNPFLISITPIKEQSAIPEGEYREETVSKYLDIATQGEGKAIFVPDIDELIPGIKEILDDISNNDELDMVLALDTTLSMKQELPVLKEKLIPLLNDYQDRIKNFRVGVLFYRDYGDDYLVKNFPFTEDLKEVQETINSAVPFGGREIPEAVFEALYNSLILYTWEAKEKIIILIGDAPPHPLPMGDITEEMVYAKAHELGVRLYTLILSQ
jgi:hypothetical protein